DAGGRAAAGRPARAACRQPRAVPARRRPDPGLGGVSRGATALGHFGATLTMYVAVKGGERAIENAHALLAHPRRGDRAVAELSLEQLSEQLAAAVDRVMSEGSLYTRTRAAPSQSSRRAAA